MKILVTGAYGFVGTNLCRYLVERGHVCDALDIPGAKRSDVPYRAFYTWDDLSPSPSPSPSPLTFTSYDAVVHLAGKAHDIRKVASEQSYFDINVGLTQRIFKALCADKEKVKVNSEKVTTFTFPLPRLRRTAMPTVVRSWRQRSICNRTIRTIRTIERLFFALP